MGQLHELLAVESGKKQALEAILRETEQVLKEKPAHFQAHIKSLEMTVDEGGVSKTPEVVERLAMTTTVPKKLGHLATFFEDLLDVNFQKEVTNQLARGTVTVDGKVLVSSAPVSFLLGLEQKLCKLREVFQHIPTHAPGVEWIPDDQHEFKGVVKSKHPSTADKTKKIIKPFVLYPHSDKHPAQVEKLPEDVKVGTYTTTHWSGMASPAEKSALLGRLDRLIEAVKIARMQANTEEASKDRCGKVIMDFLIGSERDA